MLPVMIEEKPRARRGNTEYYARWYEENKELRNQRRRERYKADSDYANSIRSDARERKRKILAERNGRVPRKWKGELVLVYPITWVAKESGVSTEKIRKLEIDGAIPEQVFKGTRVYTENQTELLLAVLADVKNNLPMSKSTMKAHANWMVGL
jgi:hypothetical protein